MFRGSANIDIADGGFVSCLSAFKPDSCAQSSTPQIDITARGQETVLARWILHRVKVERVRVVQPSLPGDGVGGKGVSGTAPRAPKMVASWKTVSHYLRGNSTRHLGELKKNGLRFARQKNIPTLTYSTEHQ